MGKPKSRKKRLVLTACSDAEELTPDEIIEANIAKVLSCIFRRLPYDALLRARLSCRDWNRVICNYTHLPLISRLVLRGDPDEVLGSLIGAPYKPWVNFRFITPLLNNSSEIQICFWEMFGAQIQSVDLVSHSLGPVAFLNILISCPKIQELSFSCKQVYDYHPPKSNYEPIIIPAHCQSLFQSSTNDILILGQLSRLKILDSNFAPPGIVREILERCVSLTELTLYDGSRTAIPHWEPRNILHFTEYRAEFLKKLELTGCNIFPEHINDLSKIKKLKLKSLHLRSAHITDLALINLFRRQNELEEIDLSCTAFSEHAFLNTGCSFQKLRKLNLSGFSQYVKSFGFLCRMPNLVDLNLSSSVSNNGLNWRQLVSCVLPIKLKKLKSLNLSNNAALGVFPGAGFFSSLIRVYSHITCLNLSGSTFIKDMFVHEIWRYMHSLRVVFLENLSGITNEALNGIRQVQIKGFMSNGSMEKVNPNLLRYQNTGGSYIGLCQKIEVLSIANNPRLTDLSTQFGIRDLCNLRRLNISGCNQITEQSLVELVHSCAFLEYLDLTGVPIPEYWVHWAKEHTPYLRRVVGKVDRPRQPQQVPILRKKPLNIDQTQIDEKSSAAGGQEGAMSNGNDSKSEASGPTSGPTGEGEGAK